MQKHINAGLPKEGFDGRYLRGAISRSLASS